LVYAFSVTTVPRNDRKDKLMTWEKAFKDTSYINVKALIISE